MLHRKSVTSLLALSFFVAGLTGSAQSAAAGSQAAVQQAVKDFLAAEQAFNPKALEALVAPTYFEISPVGEFDDHDRFLGFYAPANRVEYPPMTITEEEVRLASTGDTAVDSLLITYQMKSPDGTPRVNAIRAVFTLERESRGRWRLLCTAYTPLHLKPKQP